MPGEEGYGEALTDEYKEKMKKLVEQSKK